MGDFSFDLSRHAAMVLAEREIELAWVEEVLREPEGTETRDDGSLHLFKRIEARGGRVLRVILNHDANPPKVVTAFFDRRLSRRAE